MVRRSHPCKELGWARKGDDALPHAPIADVGILLGNFEDAVLSGSDSMNDFPGILATSEFMEGWRNVALEFEVPGTTCSAPVRRSYNIITFGIILIYCSSFYLKESLVDKHTITSTPVSQFQFVPRCVKTTVRQLPIDDPLDKDFIPNDWDRRQNIFVRIK